MCGRYVHRKTADELRLHFALSQITSNLQPRFNIAPTQQAPIIRLKDGKRELSQAKWWLIPRWSKDPAAALKYPTFNARAETVTEKPTFRDSFNQRRCLVVTDGFIEWKTEGKTKVPFLITLGNDDVLTFAGLWDRWEKPGADPIESFTIITTEANTFMQQIHHRMPVILRPEQYDAWMDNATNANDLVGMLKPYAQETEMAIRQINPAVNSSKNEGPDLLGPINSL